MVLQIDETGNLQQLQPIVGAIQFTPIDRIDGEIINATESDPDSKPQPKKDHADPTKITDKRVYQGYFLSIGRSNIVIFFMGAIIFSFTLKFPSMFVSEQFHNYFSH